MNHEYSMHYFNLKSELHEIYVSISIRTFAIMLINLFVPIYLINRGHSLQTTLLFYFTFTLTHAIMSFPAAKLSSKIGLKHSILVSIPFLIAYYLMLHSINFFEVLGIPVLVIAIFGGTSNALFFIGHHTHFAEETNEGMIGKEIGTVKILTSFFTAIGPVIGGLILTTFGFNTLFIIVSFLLFISVIPLLMSDDKHEPFRLSIEDFKGLFKLKDITGHTGYGMESSVQQVIWPIFIFFFILDEGFTALGSISSLSLLFSLMMTYAIAYNIDKKTNLFNDLGAIITSAVWVIKNFVTNSFQVLIIDSFAGLSRTAQNISFNKICYDKAKKNKTLQYIVLREFNINFAQAIIFFALSFILTGTINYSIAFIIGASGSLLFLFYRA